MAEKLRITLVKSPIGAIPKQLLRHLDLEKCTKQLKCQIMALLEA